MTATLATPNVARYCAAAPSEGRAMIVLERTNTVEMRVRTDTETFREKATNAIREAIMSLHYRPGEPLIERHLCEETGVSRTSVREALRHLEAEGLVRRESSRGLVVAELSVEEVRDIFDVRLILETELLRRFVTNAARSELTEMGLLLDRAATEAEGKGDDYTRLLSAFVHRIWAGGNNAVVVQMLASLQSRINYVRVLLYRTTTLDEHRTTIRLLRSVLEAAMESRAEDAAETYRAYLSRAQDRAIGIIKERRADRQGAQTARSPGASRDGK